MTVELPASVEKELRALAVTQSRDIGEILEEAVLLYIEAAAEARVTLVSAPPDALA